MQHTIQVGNGHRHNKLFSHVYVYVTYVDRYRFVALDTATIYFTPMPDHVIETLVAGMFRLEALGLRP
jgi:hypothetical protein